MRLRKPNPNNPTVGALQCPKCLALVISGHRHDYHSCPCKDIAVDGGRDYQRACFTSIPPKPVTIELVGGLSFCDLANDTQKRKYTLIRVRHCVANHLIYTLDKKGRFRRYFYAQP